MHLIRLETSTDIDPQRIRSSKHELEVVKAILNQAKAQRQFRGLKELPEGTSMLAEQMSLKRIFPNLKNV